MPCKKPYMQGSVAFPCGQCLPCRLRRQFQWAHRIMLEAALNGRHNTFITLTYADEHMPVLENRGGRCDIETGEETKPVGDLVPKEAQLFLKRLRKKLPFRVRFFCVGEYGGVKHRPHFHIIVFGLPSCARGRTMRKFGTTEPDPSNCCSACRLLSEVWTAGLCEQDEVNWKVARYCARYTVKKLTGPGETLYRGRHPEFARMSLKNGGIGIKALGPVKDTLIGHGLDVYADVPHGIRHGTKVMPLDKYMRRQLRKSLGRPLQAPDQVTHAYSIEMLPLLEASRSSEKSVKALVLERDEQKIRDLEAKALIFKNRDKL